MRRLLLASLAFLLFLLPFEVGGATQASARACCPCMGDMGAPACPPTCPAPSPSTACAIIAPALVAPVGVAEAAPQRAEEPLPLPATGVSLDRASLRGLDGALPRNAQASTGPPSCGDGQALLRVFRI